ncbi:MAG: tetratricopeptide repeat protein [Planctomycetota bacterium]
MAIPHRSLSDSNEQPPYIRKAMDMLEHALDTADEQKDQRVNNAGWDATVDVCHQALAICQEADHDEGVAKCYATMARLANKRQEFAEAKRLYQKAIETYDHLGSLGQPVRAESFDSPIVVVLRFLGVDSHRDPVRVCPGVGYTHMLLGFSINRDGVFLPNAYRVLIDGRAYEPILVATGRLVRVAPSEAQDELILLKDFKDDNGKKTWSAVLPDHVWLTPDCSGSSMEVRGGYVTEWVSDLDELRLFYLIPKEYDHIEYRYRNRTSSTLSVIHKSSVPITVVPEDRKAPVNPNARELMKEYAMSFPRSHASASSPIVVRR